MVKTCDYMNTSTFSSLLVIGEENKEVCCTKDIYIFTGLNERNKKTYV